MRRPSHEFFSCPFVLFVVKKQVLTHDVLDEPSHANITIFICSS